MSSTSLPPTLQLVIDVRGIDLNRYYLKCCARNEIGHAESGMACIFSKNQVTQCVQQAQQRFVFILITSRQGGGYRTCSTIGSLLGRHSRPVFWLKKRDPFQCSAGIDDGVAKQDTIRITAITSSDILINTFDMLVCRLRSGHRECKNQYCN